MFVFCALAGWPAPGSAQGGLVVRQLSFEGNRSIDDLTLAAAISTTNSSFFATAAVIRELGLGEKRRLDDLDLERDVVRLRVLYRAYGFLEVQVDTTVRRTGTDAFITFRIVEGAPVILRELDIRGADSVALPPRLLRDLPLRAGMPYNRLLLQSTADTITARLREVGYPDGRVLLVDRSVDTAARTARVQVRVNPGAPQVIGTVTVEGAVEGDSAFVVDLLTARPGKVFRGSDLLRSQRNIAATESYRFASVEIDTAAYDRNAPTVPLLVRVVPGARYRLGSSAGYGTDDCFRATGAWTIRNLLGSGRLLSFSARVSKIGTGRPLDWGLDEQVLCGRLEPDSIGSSRLNYTASVSFRQPAMFSPDNTLGLQVFAERRSEFTVYRREEVGGSVSLTREGARRIPVTVGYRLAWGSTDASDANFCAFFNACTQPDIAGLKGRQRQGVTTLGVSRLRVNNLLDPTRGNSFGVQVAHSAGWTGSDDLQRFTRVTADFSAYLPVSPGLTSALRIRGGILFAPVTQSGGRDVAYVPPDQRFYAGGANDVRGYDRNDLGPVVYVVLDPADVPPEGPGDVDPERVVVSPIGGNRVLLANAELRFPSPLFPSRWRLVAFLDGGAVWEDLTERRDPILFRLTPGMGIRIETPLGPARMDLAYNRYGFPGGTLYVTQPDGSLVPIATDYSKPRDHKLTLHLAIGQAF